MKKEPKTVGFGFLFHIASFHNAKLFHRGEKCIGFSVGGAVKIYAQNCLQAPAE